MIFPTINGNYHDYADIELNFNGLVFAGVKSINYKDTLGRSIVRGTSSVGLGLTKGNYEASGDIELYRNAAWLLMTLPGWRQVPGVITVTYIASGPLGAPTGVIPPVIVDLIPGVFLTDAEAANSQGEDALTIKLGLKIPGQILWNGVPSIIEPQLLLAVA